METKPNSVAGKPTFPNPANGITCLPTLFLISTANDPGVPYRDTSQGYLTGVMATDVP